jgi:hypothetical protein
MKFEDSGFPDKGHLRTAFNFAASNYKILSNTYVFEDTVKEAQVLHRHCPDLSDDFLSSVLLTNRILKEHLPASHPDIHLALSEADYNSQFGLNVTQKTEDLIYAWRLPVKTCGVVWRNEAELKALDTDLKKYLMASMIAGMEQIIAGRVEAYGYPKPDHPFHVKKLDRYVETFKAVSGIVPGMDREYADLMPKARAAVETFRP